LCSSSAPPRKIHNQAINIGANEQNYQVRDVGNAVARLVPQAKIVYTGEVGPDPRNYRVKFDKLTGLFPISASNTISRPGSKSCCRNTRSTTSVSRISKATSLCACARSRKL